MTKTLFTLKHTFTRISVLLLAIATLFSCTDKDEYEMELRFQREITRQALYENNRILMRIEKEVDDSGKIYPDTAIRNHARDIIIERNKSIDSAELFVVLVDSITQLTNLGDISKNNSFELLNYYHKKYKETRDSMVFQKLINVYLTIEEIMLNDDLMKVANSCNFGHWFNVHVSKDTDTARVGEIYELALIPDTFDHKTSFVNDDCKLTVYKNGKPEEMKYTILKKKFSLFDFIDSN